MELRVGMPAPDFTLPLATFGTVSLSNMRGKPVVLYFYPKDDTPGCTTEACAFRDILPRFADFDAAVIGISKDSVDSHSAFVKKYGLNFHLASDENGQTCEEYGVWGEKSMYGRTFMGIERTTFLIDSHGFIRHIWRRVSVTGHAEEVREMVERLHYGQPLPGDKPVVVVSGPLDGEGKAEEVTQIVADGVPENVVEVEGGSKKRKAVASVGKAGKTDSSAPQKANLAQNVRNSAAGKAKSKAKVKAETKPKAKMEKASVSSSKSAGSAKKVEAKAKATKAKAGAKSVPLVKGRDKTSPVKKTPEKMATPKKVPAAKPSVGKTQAKKAAVGEKVSTKSAKKVSSPSLSVKKTGAKKTPVKKAPVKKAAVKKAPVKKAAVKKKR